MNERFDMTPVALYAQVSSDRQDVDLSVAAQLRALRDYAEDHDYLVARERFISSPAFSLGRTLIPIEFQSSIGTDPTNLRVAF